MEINVRSLTKIKKENDPKEQIPGVLKITCVEDFKVSV